MMKNTGKDGNGGRSESRDRGRQRRIERRDEQRWGGVTDREMNGGRDWWREEWTER